MWRPTETVPQEILNLLADEEEDVVNDDDGMLEEEEADESDDLPVFSVAPDGTLNRVGPGGDVSEPTPSDDLESDDEEWEQAHEIITAAISPLSSPVRSRSPVAGPSSAPDPSFRIEILEPGRNRGRPSIRGRGRGRGTRGRGVGVRGLRGMNERRWRRGDELEEVFVNDTDLPLNIQEQIRAHLAGRARNERSRNADRVDEENEDEVYFDANEEFVWQGTDGWEGERCAFTEPTGPTTSFERPYDAFQAIWTDEIVEHIAFETNRYAQEVVSPERPRFMRDWFQTNLHEIWTLFAFWIMLGIVRMPTIKSCFAKNPLLRTDVFRHLFTESRYWDLNAAFHLVEGTDDLNPLHPMGPIIDHLNLKFKELYRMDQEICIDESLTLWKGPVGFQQYIRTKAARFGIKTYELCESATGYLWAFFIYCGRATGSGNLPSSVSSVLRLIQPLLNLGYTLYMDNWFNSPSLARWLKRRNTDCVGTLRPSRKGVPEVIKRAPLQEGQFVARACDDMVVVALQDRKRVTCLSTYHNLQQVVTVARPGHPSQHKLKLVSDYNKAMGGVDRMDSMLEAYLVERKQCKKWNKKLFKRLLNVSVQNARIIVEKSTNAKVDSLAFRLILVQEIIDRHLHLVPRRPAPAQQRRNPIFPIGRLTERHFIRRIPVTDAMKSNVKYRTNVGRRNCVWCTHHNRRSTTAYECAECGLALCLDNCFKDFHTTS